MGRLLLPNRGPNRRLTVEDLKGLPAYQGLDLSESDDLTALATIAGDLESGVYLLSHYWCPEENLLNLEHATNMPYRLWAQEGWLTPTPGNAVDYRFIRKTISDLAPKLDLKKILCDPWKAATLAGQIQDEDELPIDYIRQGIKSLTGPTMELKRLIDARLLIHDANPITRWCFSNAIARLDENNNPMLGKRLSRKKIDGASAAVNAIAAMMVKPEPKLDIYNSRGILSL